MIVKTSRAARVARRAHRVWSELNYAQRRLFELRTGVPVPPRRRDPGVSAGYFVRPYRRA